MAVPIASPTWAQYISQVLLKREKLPTSTLHSPHTPLKSFVSKLGHDDSLHAVPLADSAPSPLAVDGGSAAGGELGVG